jgi:hypothetical protein
LGAGRANASKSSLFSGQSANDRKPQRLFLRVAVHEKRPQTEASDHQQQIDRQFHYQEEALGQSAENYASDEPYNPKRDPGDVEKDRLKGMEANEPILLEGLHNQEDDSCNRSRKIRKGAGELRGERVRRAYARGWS